MRQTFTLRHQANDGSGRFLCIHIESLLAERTGCNNEKKMIISTSAVIRKVTVM